MWHMFSIGIFLRSLQKNILIKDYRPLLFPPQVLRPYNLMGFWGFGVLGWVNYEIYETQKNKKHNLVLELYILKGSEAGDGYSS